MPLTAPFTVPLGEATAPVRQIVNFTVFPSKAYSGLRSPHATHFSIMSVVPVPAFSTYPAHCIGLASTLFGGSDVCSSENRTIPCPQVYPAQHKCKCALDQFKGIAFKNTVVGHRLDDLCPVELRAFDFRRDKPPLGLPRKQQHSSIRHAILTIHQLQLLQHQPWRHLLRKANLLLPAHESQEVNQFPLVKGVEVLSRVK